MHSEHASNNQHWKRRQAGRRAEEHRQRGEERSVLSGGLVVGAMSVCVSSYVLGVGGWVKGARE